MFFENGIDDYILINNDNLLVDDSLGLMRGNMFKDEYIPFNNKKETKLLARDEKERLLLKIYETNFALNDISLYLDVHPNDNYIYDVFKNYVNTYKNYKKEYESKYGPLTLDSIDNTTYSWINNPWPWEDMEDAKYV